MRYGLSYQGSKSKLADKIVAVLPRATHFYDVFCGGGAVSHAALLSGKWQCVHFSDITNSVELFRDCLEGNIPDGSEWISREEFFMRLDEPYVRILWSFGNNQREYLYSKELEPYKKAVHEMIFAPTPNERRLKFRKVCQLIPYILGLNGGGTEIGINGKMPEIAYRLQHCEPQLPPPSAISQTIARPPIQRSIPEALYRLEPMERIERGGYNNLELHRLQSEERRENCPAPFCGGQYEAKVCDYREVEILPDSIIYADKPYKGTEGYLKRKDGFDHDAFWDWAEAQEVPVFISEYWCPPERFKVIAEWDRTSSFSATNNGLKMKEKLFVPNKWYDKYKPIEQKSLFDDL